MLLIAAAVLAGTDMLIIVRFRPRTPVVAAIVERTAGCALSLCGAGCAAAVVSLCFEHNADAAALMLLAALDGLPRAEGVGFLCNKFFVAVIAMSFHAVTAKLIKLRTI